MGISEIKEDILFWGIAGTIGIIGFGIGLAGTAIKIPLSFYNYIAKNERTIKNPEKIKIPKSTKNLVKIIQNEGENTIEIKYGQVNKELSDLGVHRGYNINLVQNNETIKTLAEAVVTRYCDIEPPPISPFRTCEYWFYNVSAFFPNSRTAILRIPKIVNVKYFGGEVGAEEVAHQTALSIAKKIANYSHIPVKDYSLRDKSDLQMKLNN